MSLQEAQSVAQLKPAFFIHLTVEEPQLIYDNAAESLVLVKVKNGYTKSLDSAYQFDTTVEFGIDNLRTSKETPGTTTLDCQLYLKSKANGKGIHFSYSGVVTASEAQNAVIAGKLNSHDYTDGYVTNHPVVVLDSDAKEESWISSKNLIGKGHFVRDSEGVLAVEYYVYVLE